MLAKDIDRGVEIAKTLLNAISRHDFFSEKNMPEFQIPKGLERGSKGHILFITLTASLDYLRDATQLWDAARKTFEDPDTNYLFDPELVVDTPEMKVSKDLKKYSLSRRNEQDSAIWEVICSTLCNNWGGDPRNILEHCGWDAPSVLMTIASEKKKLSKDCANEIMRKMKKGFPFLSGPKIGPMWIRMLYQLAGLSQIKRMDHVPIPVDLHIKRATLSTGILQVKSAISEKKLHDEIRGVWFEIAEKLRSDGQSVLAVELDVPLWLLSKHGCTKNKSDISCDMAENCLVKEFCIRGSKSRTTNRIN